MIAHAPQTMPPPLPTRHSYSVLSSGVAAPCFAFKCKREIKPNERHVAFSVTVLHDPHGQGQVAPSVRTYHTRCLPQSLAADARKRGILMPALSTAERTDTRQQLDDVADGRTKKRPTEKGNRAHPSRSAAGRATKPK